VTNARHRGVRRCGWLQARSRRLKSIGFVKPSARGQRLIALRQLLPQISAGVSENVEQVSASTLGIKTPLMPQIIGPYAYSTVEASASQTLFSYESLQRFRAARTTEQAANLKIIRMSSTLR